MNVIFFLTDWISLIAYSVLIFLVLKEFVPLRFQNRFFHILEIACLLVGGNADRKSTRLNSSHVF